VHDLNNLTFAHVHDLRLDGPKVLTFNNCFNRHLGVPVVDAKKFKMQVARAEKECYQALISKVHAAYRSVLATTMASIDQVTRTMQDYLNITFKDRQSSHAESVLSQHGDEWRKETLDYMLAKMNSVDQAEFLADVWSLQHEPLFGSGPNKLR